MSFLFAGEGQRAVLSSAAVPTKANLWFGIKVASDGRTDGRAYPRANPPGNTECSNTPIFQLVLRKWFTISSLVVGFAWLKARADGVYRQPPNLPAKISSGGGAEEGL
jgi:hypothetical protein